MILDLLIEGLDDWLNDGFIYGMARGEDDAQTAESVRLKAWGAVAELLIRRWATAGDLDADGVFIERPGPAGDVLVEIFSQWLQRWGDGMPKDWDFCLSNTALGDEVARQALQEATPSTSV